MSGKGHQDVVRPLSGYSALMLQQCCAKGAEAKWAAKSQGGMKMHQVSYLRAERQRTTWVRRCSQL